ncbi:hypothetical protein K438DRAFT_1470282, partial [Mycena galopus ATCC 62051]
AKKRPKEVKDWVSRARKYTPCISDPTAFDHGWWAWWLDISPEWHGVTRPMLQASGKSWVEMDLYGQNSFLNVLMALKWWHGAMDEALPDWEDAIADFMWAL